MSRRADVLIVGAGIAGASLAAAIKGRASVIMLEAEDQPGYHSTGRSAAFWSESYGGPLVQPLTTASGPFLHRPSADFHDRSFLRPRGAVYIADAEGKAELNAMRAALAETSIDFQPLGREDLVRILPGLEPGWTSGLLEPSCADIDVAALHGAYLRAARQTGASLFTNARVESATRLGGEWRIETRQGEFRGSILVNAAGAWADHVASLANVQPIGIQPYRRTIAQLRIDPPAPADLPLIIDASGRFYLKPEAGGRLWLSPHDESPCVPCDSAPDEEDVALAIDRLEKLVGWRVTQVEHRWSGLRSFAPDRLPVYGYAAGDKSFFWCAGQGGFGIQTAPAAAKLAAALLRGKVPELDPTPYAPARFAA